MPVAFPLQTIPAHFLLFMAFAFSPHPFPLLSSHPSKHHSPIIHSPSLLVQQLLVTTCFPSSPFCPASLALSFHYCLVAPLTDTASVLTQPQLSPQPGSKTQADLKLCKLESSWFFFFKWKEGIIQEHGILITFSLKKIIAGFHKNFHKTSPSEAQKVFTAMIKA